MSENHVFPRHTHTALPMAVRGEGCYLYDSTGKQYLDGSGGAAVSCLGHKDPDVISAVQSQVENLAFAHTGFFTSEPAEKLANLLISQAPGHLNRVYFVSGGSEAVESALKLARQYYLEIGEPRRDRVISRKQSYHGNTLGALSAGGNMWRREPFSPLLTETSHISACYPYRDREQNETEEGYGIRVANELETEILRLGDDRVMAFIAETVVGATLGAATATKGYFKRIREICDQYGVLLILDEVMCGMGRTGSLFAYEQEGIYPDIVTIAKGLGGGYQAIGAMLCSDNIYKAFEKGSGFFQHGHTYLGHPVACAAGHAVVTAILERQLIDQVQAQGEKLRNLLTELCTKHPQIGDIRGRGLFIGVELVQDKQSKQPFSAEKMIHKSFKKTAFNNGLICYPMGGTIDGKQGDHVLLAPPYIITDHQLEELVTKFSATLSSIFNEVLQK